MRTLWILALLLLCPIAYAGGVDYPDACAIRKVAQKSGMQEMTVQFKSGEAICTSRDGCFAVRYSATVLDGPPSDVGRDVAIVAEADIVLGESYLAFAAQTKDVDPPIVTFESKKDRKKIAYKIPDDVRFLISQGFLFSRTGDTFYRTFPKGVACAGSPDCDWIRAHGLYSAGTVETVKAPYVGLTEELKRCKATQIPK